MSDILIRAQGLGKRYLIGHGLAERERPSTLRDMITRTTREFGRAALKIIRGHQIVKGGEVEEFWALKDVSFEIKRGDVVGIIGRNGAGKSTLLKILSRITEPTEGRVEIKGRVASLLEVGTGFHPELTGRENIYLNGAILGMSRAEIRAKFDEIVEFAEVERFLDTPVKRYSSGMYVRLAFAVAAHLEPEILVVDEVLAVGDAEFQKKCLGKIRDVASHGRTVLFVSHNTSAISRLCPSVIWLHDGRVRDQGETTRLLDDYGRLARMTTAAISRRATSSPAMFRSIDIRAEGRGTGLILNTDPVLVTFEIEVKEPIRDLRLSVGVCSESGEVIFATAPADSQVILSGKSGVSRYNLRIPPQTFLPKEYRLMSSLWTPLSGTFDRIEDVAFAPLADASSKIRSDSRFGFVTIDCKWSEVSLEGSRHMTNN